MAQTCAPTHVGHANVDEAEQFWIQDVCQLRILIPKPLLINNTNIWIFISFTIDYYYLLQLETIYSVLYWLTLVCFNGSCMRVLNLHLVRTVGKWCQKYFIFKIVTVNFPKWSDINVILGSNINIASSRFKFIQFYHLTVKTVKL